MARRNVTADKTVIYTTDGGKVVDCQTRRRASATCDITEFFSATGKEFLSDEKYLRVGGCERYPERIAEALKYTRTKFFRLIIELQRLAQFDPIHPYNVVLDSQYFGCDRAGKPAVDYSGSVAEIDAQLYRRYEFTPEMIAFVEDLYHDDVCDEVEGEFAELRGSVHACGSDVHDDSAGRNSLDGEGRRQNDI